MAGIKAVIALVLHQTQFEINPLTPRHLRLTRYQTPTFHLN